MKMEMVSLIVLTQCVRVASVCGRWKLEDCTLVGDEDGNGLADCQEQVCDGQIMVDLQGSYNPQAPATCEYGQVEL